MGPLCVPCAVAFAAWSPRLLASGGPRKKSSCGWAQRAGSAQGAVPRSLAGSAAVIGCFSDQPDALTCHRGRGHAATLASESVPEGRKGAPPVGSDDAAGGRAVSRRCGGFAQSCGWCCSFDRARSDPCSRHQHGSCGRSFVRLARDRRPLEPHHGRIIKLIFFSTSLAPKRSPCVSPMMYMRKKFKYG
jgi:hypothetical protein